MRRCARRVTSLPAKQRALAALAKRLPRLPRCTLADATWAVTAASKRVPGTKCLPWALALHGLLAQAGIASELRIGVAADGDALKAHAWVECGDETLTWNEPVEPYSVLARAWSRRERRRHELPLVRFGLVDLVRAREGLLARTPSRAARRVRARVRRAAHRSQLRGQAGRRPAHAGRTRATQSADREPTGPTIARNTKPCASAERSSTTPSSAPRCSTSSSTA